MWILGLEGLSDTKSSHFGVPLTGGLTVVLILCDC